MKSVSGLAFVGLTVCLLIFTFLGTSVCAVQEVGVREGDWMEYDIAVTGVGSLPPSHDVRWMRITVFAIEGEAFSADVAVRYANGSMGSSIWRFNFTEGNTGGWLIIPANLGLGDTFLDYTQPERIVIQREEQKSVLGATRTVTCGSDSIRYLKEWDKATGIFVGSVEIVKDFTDESGWYVEDLTMTITATATNMWRPQIFGLEPPIFALAISGLVLVIVVIVSVLIIWQREKLTRLSLRYSLLSKRIIPAIIIVGIIVLGATVLPSFLMGIGLYNAEVNMIMQSYWMSLLLVSIGFRIVGKYFVHGFLMSAVVIATLIGFAQVLIMWSPADSIHMTSVYFSEPNKIIEFIAHGIFSIPALVLGAWFIALWRPNSDAFPARSRRVAKWLIIMWVLSYLVGLLGYIIDYTTLFGGILINVA